MIDSCAPGRLTNSAMLFGTALGSLALQAATRLPTYRILVGESILCMTSHGSCMAARQFLLPLDGSFVPARYPEKDPERNLPRPAGAPMLDE